MNTAGHRKQLLTAALLAATAVAIVVAVVKLRDTKAVATDTAAIIEAELNALDPVARAATLGKLAKDATIGARVNNS